MLSRNKLSPAGSIQRRARIKPRSPRHAAGDRLYTRDAKAYLLRHPYCQIFIVRHGLDEREVIERRGLCTRTIQGKDHFFSVPRSTEIHHRNKRTGARKNDQRFWMAASRAQHEWAEENKTAARSCGISLPINADADGRWGDGSTFALTTPELMRSVALMQGGEK